MTQESATQKTNFLVPTITKQSWSFMIGSSLFAIGSGISMWGPSNDATLANFLCFIGAWFFTTAGFLQLALSGPASVPVSYAPGKMFRAEWLAAATQSFGTVLFNVSTTGALAAHTTDGQKHYVWNPDAAGSVAFLVSACFVYVAFYRDRGKNWEPKQPGWWSCQINMIGCIAFGVSAVGAFILPDGNVANNNIANWGTFIGAVCFFTASAIALPKLPWNRSNS